MAKTTKVVTRDAVDAEALALLRSTPAEYIRTTHRDLPSVFRKVRTTGKPPVNDDQGLSSGCLFKDAQEAVR